MIRHLHDAARRLLRATLPAEIRDAVVGDLDDEMADRISRGADPREALSWSIRQTLGSLPAAARLRVASLRSARRETRKRGYMVGIWQDVRYSARLLRRSPLLACAVIATLALGIGATTAIFSVVHAALLRELPYREPDRIVRIYETFGGNQISRGVVNPANYDHWERHAKSFSHMAAMRGSSATLTRAGDPLRVNVESVLPAFFEAIGVLPAIGRPLTAADAEGAASPVLLSHDLWTSRFGGDASIVGRTIVLNGTSRPVAGVMPAGFRFPYEPDLWQVLTLSQAARASSRSWYLGAVARLAPGVTVADAQIEMDRLSSQLRELEPARQKNRGAWVVSLHEDLVYRVTDGLAILQGAVLLVLLIAIANVANLLLAHSTARQREFAVRAAIGAGRQRIFRQLLTESLMLGVTGAAGGALLAVWGVRALVALSPLRLGDGMEPAVNLPVLLFALTVGVVTSIVFGLAPALIAARSDLAGPVKEGSHTTIGGARSGSGRLRSLLVVSETALAVMLLVGAGLLMRSFTLLLAQDVGFTVDRVVTAQTTLPSAQYDTPEKRAAFWRALFERLGTLPGVAAAGGSTAVPFSNWEWQTDFRVVGREDVRNDGTGIRTVHPGYFPALGIPLLKGRGFTDRDNPSSEPVLVVNDVFAREHLRGLDPVGQRVRFGRDESEKPHVIVGVTGSTRHASLDGAAGPEVYRPLQQQPPATLVLAIRAAADPRALISLIPSTIHQIDPDLPVQHVRTMDEMIARTVADRRFYLTLMTTFSGLALTLALLGVYGVMSYTVGQRTREIGIRMALGAAPQQVQRLVLRSALILVGTGLVLGLAGAAFTSNVLRSLLFGVTSRDPVTIGSVTAALGLLSVVAAYLPARRARRLDPVTALRCE
jgi:predicted permease